MSDRPSIIQDPTPDPATIAVVGLGSMGSGVARALLQAGYKVVGVDRSQPLLDRLVADGGGSASTPAEAAREAGCVVCVVVNAAQTEAVLFGEAGCARAMPAGAVFLSCATMPPAEARRLAARLEAEGRHYVDAPLSGGSARAEAGTLSVMASGSEAAIARARPVLDAMASTLHVLGDTAGVGSAFKMVNQLLAGVHIAAACEAMAFAVREGLDLRRVYEVITKSAGNSWMFENRMPHVLDGDYTARSSVDIFTKDLGIVLDMARANGFATPVAGAALQMFLMTAAAGMGGDDDASVARLYARIAGLDLPARE